MPRYIAFLRGINLSRRRVKMDHLQSIVTQLPATDVSTFIASGNVFFSSAVRSASKLEGTVSKLLERELGYPVAVTIRTPTELAAIVANAPLGDLWAD